MRYDSIRSALLYFKQAIAEQGHSLGLTLRYFCEEVKAEEVEVEYEVKVEFEDDF